MVDVKKEKKEIGGKVALAPIGAHGGATSHEAQMKSKEMKFVLFSSLFRSMGDH